MRLHYWLLEGEAYRSLDVVARAVLIELYRLYNGSNNGDLFLSVRKAAQAVHVGKSRAAKALHDLVDRGFVKPRQHGSFHWKMRHATTWVLTEHPFGSHPATTEFMRWKAVTAEGKSTVPTGGQIVRTDGQAVSPTGQQSSPYRDLSSSGGRNRTICPDPVPAGGHR